MGEYGNNVMIYDTESIILKHQIPAGRVLRSFEFTKNGSNEIVLVTDDLKIMFYKLDCFAASWIREIATVHRGSINSVDLSQNGAFMMTGGQDNLLKVWDYSANKSVPYFYQAFIGHTYPIQKVIFSPIDNETIISIAGQDGIYIWEFHGDTRDGVFEEQQYNMNEEEDHDKENRSSALVYDRNALHAPTLLEKMRFSVKERKKPKLAEYSFNVLDFIDCPNDQEAIKLMEDCRSLIDQRILVQA